MSKGTERDKIYGVWKGMIKRCQDESDRFFADYGARGISVCDRWKTFRNFFSDMSPRPPGMTLERSDNSMGYSLENCRWATQGEQAKNKRRYKCNKSGVTGVAWDSDANRWRARIRVDGKLINLGRFKTLEDAAEIRRQKELEFGFGKTHGGGR